MMMLVVFLLLSDMVHNRLIRHLRKALNKFMLVLGLLLLRLN